MSINNQSTDTSVPDSSNFIPNTFDTAQQTDSSIPSAEIPIQKSSRIIKPASFLRYFHCSMLSHEVLPTNDKVYPLANFLSYDSLSPSHKNFVMAVFSQYEPQFYHQAVKFQQWRTAMKEELDAMELNKTWSVVSLSKGKHSRLQMDFQD